MTGAMLLRPDGATVAGTEPLCVERRVDDRLTVFRPAAHLAQLTSAADELDVPRPTWHGLLGELRRVLRGCSRIGADADAMQLRPVLGERLRMVAEPAKTQLRNQFRPRTLRVGARGSRLSTVHSTGWRDRARLSEDSDRNVELPDGVHLFLRYPDRLVTASVEHERPTVTSRALRTLAADDGVPTEHRDTPIDRLWADCIDGAVREAFVCAAAPVLVPVGAIRCGAHRWTIGNGQPGPLLIGLRRRFTAIRTGRTRDAHHWMCPLPQRLETT